MTVSREWYLLQTKARREAVARENLERQGYVTWLPRLRVRRPRSERIESLFPGYRFVRLSPEVDNFGPIRSTIGVPRLVRFGAAYARVPDAWVDELKSHASADDVCEVRQKALAPATVWRSSRARSRVMRPSWPGSEGATASRYC